MGVQRLSVLQREGPLGYCLGLEYPTKSCVLHVLKIRAATWKMLSSRKMLAHGNGLPCSNPANPFVCSYDWDGGEGFGHVHVGGLLAPCCGFGWSQVGMNHVWWCMHCLVDKHLWSSRQGGARHSISRRV